MMKRLLLCLLTISLAGPSLAKEWFVRQADANASETADGSAAHPLRAINAAAQLAEPGDVVTVGPGIYHEWVSPARGGDASHPILYRSIPEHAAIVRGTDILQTQWQPATNLPGVFSASLPQAAFVFGNPFAGPAGSKRNALVFLKDQPLAQVTTREQLAKTPDAWLASDDAQQLFIHLHGNTAPGPGTIEITTRDRLFAPHRRGLGCIHVEGFIFERCAARPSWPQLGAISTRTGNYWIIRNNIVRYTTGKGIDCGSETWEAGLLSATEPADKRLLIGGGHLIENNLLTDNEQCGIAAWNTYSVSIIGNIVRSNATVGGEQPHPPNSLADAEAAGIKVHAFRHGLIEGNLVVANSSFGIWLDNGWEDARVTRNVAVGNRGAGIFVELGFGPALVDHNLSAANTLLWKPYFGDGIYTHDASGITIAHNTLLDNAHYGLEQLVVSQRSYANRRLAEASNETITGNLFYGNRDGNISLPLDSPRSRHNVSDHNALDPAVSFIINNNAGRIPIEAILKSCREQLKAAQVPENQCPDLSDTNGLPKLSLPAWRVVMQMDQSSKPLPDKFAMRVNKEENLLQINLPSPTAISTPPAGASDDFDLLGQAIKSGEAHAGAIQNVNSQIIRLWPLPAVSRSPGGS
jgi:Right handed beta helix region